MVPSPTELIIMVISITFVYVPICIGKISSKLGYNGILFGILSLVPIANIVILGILAFGENHSKQGKSGR